MIRRAPFPPRIPTRPVAVGLMSGTSADAVSAVVARLSERGLRASARILAEVHVPYPEPVRRRILAAQRSRLSDVCELSFEVGEAFAAAANRAIRRAGTRPHFVASHGQTIRHVPRGPTPSTLQVGHGSVIAARTGLPVVSDFRPADIAAGGEGAPLVPLADEAFFRAPGRTRVLLNLGGIANVTVLPADGSPAWGFDTGPANGPLDETIRRWSRGRIAYDADGEMARLGEVDTRLLGRLLADPYFRRRPPKSTGKERFGAALAARLASRGRRVESILATLVELAACSVADAIERFVRPAPEEVIASGGGCLNGFLLQRIRARLAPLPVETSDVLGVPVLAREALAFAYLGWRTLRGLPGNLPGATGARRPAVLGVIALP
ncbi:MAG: anhydro-N-acetylmuramic acid kinase [Planctomycetota bacterium]